MSFQPLNFVVKTTISMSTILAQFELLHDLEIAELIEYLLEHRNNKEINSRVQKWLKEHDSGLMEL